MRDNPITMTVDLDRDGVQHGYLRLPHSRDDSAWGHLLIPLSVVKRGDGPTALLTGGNHGDEYEGPIALLDLTHRLTPDEVSGRVIVLPVMNYPALDAGARTSPIDRGNLNRSFPGGPDGTVTEKIADFFQRTLLPMADIVLDIHSGGKTLEFLPLVASHILPDKEQETRCRAAADAFAAPYTLQLREIDAVGMYDTAAEEMGKVFLTTELGGGGTTTAHSLQIARRGISNLLAHAGILTGDCVRESSISLHMPGECCYIFSESDGLLEPCVSLGADVASGDTVARVWPVNQCGRSPREYRAKMDGLLTGRHFPSRIRPGDCLAMLAKITE